ncbi:MAG: cell division protein FtsQ/DivIB [Chitinispirillales bacterium]|jgi:hypothetical protein|nr:cell division protein FtsQ/DivIB [Chitinispirillales bacterium]
MSKKPMSKKPAAKKPMPGRIGANTRKRMEEARAQRPGAIARLAGRISKVVATATIVAAAGFAVFTYSPAVWAKAAETAKTTKKLSANVRIVKCGKQTQKLLENALDSLLRYDTLSFDRAEILRAAATIPEIEKIGIKRARCWASREKITRIKITEREPVALVHCGNIFLVDKKGIRFAVRPGQFYDLPLLVIDDRTLQDTVDMKIFNTIRKTSRTLGNSFFQQISQIDVSDNSAVNLLFKSGEAEYVVGYEDIENRLPHIKELRERLLEGPVKPVRVDMRYRSLAFSSTQ